METTSADVGVDMLTKRPHTPKDPYTTMTEEQIKNVPKDPQAFFHFSRPEKPYPEKGWYKDRYATNTNQHLLRGPPLSHPYCWVDQQWTRDPQGLHNASRLGASQRWGPDKVGQRTVQHFNQPEDSKRFVTIDMYRRPPTNMPGYVTMDYGRPSEGYYSQKNPNFTTWFGSTVPLKKLHGLPDVYRKTSAQYQEMRKDEHVRVKERKNKFPAYSEYTDRFSLQTRLEPMMTMLQRRKKYLEESAEAAS
ncbi:hypothetical protein ACJMK2_008313 [Sinanodonta woodiana]|uniref:Uncharacterized protein n=1 Tax=Sinanodonta woodiana TaxID=1069815 RepID=A0ABD3VL72_SINWO